jgi:hypothetical protein
VPLAWSSAVGDVHPAFYDAEGTNFLRSFQGGLFITGGLDQFGAPCSDTGEDLGLHGRVHHLPARMVSYQGTWMGNEYDLTITGEIRQARLFGENLVLRRAIFTSLGWNVIHIHDFVINEGFERWPHMILYHFNLGFPLISPASQLEVPAERTYPRDGDAERGFAEWRSLQPPTAGYTEQVFGHVPIANARGKTRVQVSNPDLGIGVAITFSPAELPHLFQWKMMGEGAYVLGIEPANSSGMEGRAIARERDDLPYLNPGEGRQYSVDFEVFELE